MTPRMSGRVGTALQIPGIIGAVSSLTQAIYKDRTEFNFAAFILFTIVAVVGWMLSRRDSQVRRLGFWNYRPDTSGAWLVGTIIFSSGVLVTTGTLSEWIRSGPAVDSFVIILFLIGVIAGPIGLLLILRDNGTTSEANIGGDTKSERQ